MTPLVCALSVPKAPFMRGKPYYVYGSPVSLHGFTLPGSKAQQMTRPGGAQVRECLILSDASPLWALSAFASPA